MKKHISTIFVGILSIILGGALGYIIGKNSSNEDEMKNKMLKYYATFNSWLELKQNNKNLSDYFEKMGYKTIAIYGMKEVGERLYCELRDSDIDVKYAIDQNADSIFSDLNVYSLDDSLPEVDAIIVTPVYYYNSILSKLADKVNCPVISLDDVIGSLKRN